MNSEQKRAWFVVGVFAVVLAGVLVVVPFAGWGAFGVTGLLGFWGLTPLLFRKKRYPGQVATDERDRMILEKATLGGGMTSYLWFVLACMVLWFIHMYQGKKTISIHVLPFIVLGGAAALMVVRAVATLILYGREGRRGED